MPLPETCGSQFRAFVEARTFFQRTHNAVLRLEDAEAARFGDTRQVAALIVLDRQSGGRAELTRLTAVRSLTALLETASSPALDTGRVVRDMRELARKVPGYVLRYSDSAEAAALLKKELCGVAPES